MKGELEGRQRLKTSNNTIEYYVFDSRLTLQESESDSVSSQVDTSDREVSDIEGDVDFKEAIEMNKE